MNKTRNKLDETRRFLFTAYTVPPCGFVPAFVGGRYLPLVSAKLVLLSLIRNVLDPDERHADFCVPSMLERLPRVSLASGKAVSWG